MAEYPPSVLRKKIKKINAMMLQVEQEKGADHKEYKKLKKKLQSYENDLSALAAGNNDDDGKASTNGSKNGNSSIKDRLGAYQSKAAATSSSAPTLKSRSAAFQKAAGANTTPTTSNAVTPSPKNKKVGTIKSKSSPFGDTVGTSKVKSPSPSSNTKKKVKKFKPVASPATAASSSVSSSPGKNQKFGSKTTPSPRTGSLRDRSAAFQNAAAASAPSSAAPSKTVTPKKFGSVAAVAPSPTNGTQKVGKLKTGSPFGAKVASSSPSPTAVTPSPGRFKAPKKKNKTNIGSVDNKTDIANKRVSTPFGGGTPSKLGKLKAPSPFKPNAPGKYTSTNKQMGTPPPKKNSNLLTKTTMDASTETRAQAVIACLQDKSLADTVRELVERIDNAGGFPTTRRLSVRDNDLVSSMTKAIHNDPTITEIVIDSDPRFEHVSKTLVDSFAESLRSNLHITKLSIQGVELGNQFLSSLANSIETNFTLREINLRNNCFTNDALIEFCQSMASNKTLLKVDLSKQNSPIFENAEDAVFESLEQNDIVKSFKLDFKTKQGPKKLKKLLERNKTAGNSPVDGDEKLLEFLRYEVERAEELFEQRKAEETNLVVKDDDWGYLYELSQLFDKYKLGDLVVLDDDDGNGNHEDGLGGQSRSPARPAIGRTRSASSDGRSTESNDPVGFTMPLTADGAFLNEEFISCYLHENKEKDSLTFDFCNQFKVFKRFPKTDPARPLIVKKFVDALLAHPRMKDITSINMANSCCDNDFFEELADRCFDNEQMLPKLNTLNAETNFITEKGAVAIARCVGSPTTFKYLQVLRLENQKGLLSSKAELKLARALCVNRSVIRFSLRVRNLLERQQINKYIQRNVDFLRQARRHHAIQTGTLQERKRNEMEQYFDRIAENDPSITEVEIVGNNRFMSLNQEEKVKAGAAFACNTHVKTLLMSTLKLDCEFAVALAKSLETNNTIERVLLDSNAIADEGLSAIIASMSKNSTVTELQVRHQSKATSSATEDELCDLLGDNTTLVKLGLDIRSQLAKIKLDKKLAQNREIQRKARVKAGK